MLVWNAMPSITLVMSLIRLLEPVMASIVVMTLVHHRWPP